MCGFAGEFVLDGTGARVELARKMASTLAHRGPDEAGEYLCPQGRCAIGFRRLAVIDPADSHQPMTSADGAVTVAFNGEIYNYRELRSELRSGGASFRTAGDTEILLHMYRRHGRAMLPRLEGMFAIAVYDRPAGTLFLARDRLGQKPLWYSTLDASVLFASQARALLQCPDVNRAADAASISLYMSFGYIPAPHSIWSGLRKLQPGHSVVFPAQADPEPFWSPNSKTCGSDSGNVREVLRASVERHMVSDVPLGALLSGGIDSSIIVSLMAEVSGKAGGVRTFTAGFDDSQYDERRAAAAVARHIGTDHTEILIHPRPAEELDELVALYDEPFADSSALPTWHVCKAARQHVTVALAGDGGDEVFCGYDRYRALHLAATMRPPAYLATSIAAALLRPFAPKAERSRLRRFVRFAASLQQPFARQYLTYRGIFRPENLPRLFTPDFAAEIDLEAPGRWFMDLYEQAEADDEPGMAQRHDMLTYLPDDLLVKTDIASMAHSLELRAPFLDRGVVELGLSLPLERRLNRGRGKLALREAFADALPPEVFRRPKRGFGVPLARWLRGPLAETLCETLTDPSFLGRGIFRAEAIAGLVNDHLTGRDDHSHRLWALLVLARWLAMRP